MRDLKALREALGLTQFEAARRARLDRTRLSLAENGHVQLTIRELEALRSALTRAAKKRADQIGKLTTGRVLQRANAGTTTRLGRVE